MRTGTGLSGRIRSEGEQAETIEHHQDRASLMAHNAKWQSQPEEEDGGEQGGDH